MKDTSQGQGRSPANDPEGAMMYVACSRCKAILDIKPGNLGSITHSFCDDCRKAMLREVEEFKKRREGKWVSVFKQGRTAARGSKLGSAHPRPAEQSSSPPET